MLKHLWQIIMVKIMLWTSKRAARTKHHDVISYSPGIQVKWLKLKKNGHTIRRWKAWHTEFPMISAQCRRRDDAIDSVLEQCKRLDIKASWKDSGPAV